MRLHEDKKNFDAIIQRVYERTGINPSIIEKDYYVSLMLQEIGDRQNEVPAYFKGGTCLYKIYMNMKRFSEDIDLTVKISELSNSQAKRALEKAAYGYNSMERMRGDVLEENRKGSITSIFGYTPMYDVNTEDRLQRYGKVKIEATSFTVSEPHEANTTSSLIYQYATESERAILKEYYSLNEFTIQNISIERIFADKILATEFYLEREEYFDVAKHLYDIAAMSEHQRVKTLLSNEERLIQALSYKREEEKVRIGSNLYKKPLKELQLFTFDFNKNKAFICDYEDMQRLYVIDDSDKISLKSVSDCLSNIKPIFAAVSDKEYASLKKPNKARKTFDEER